MPQQPRERTSPPEIVSVFVPVGMRSRLIERSRALGESFNDFLVDALELHLDATESADFSELVTLPAPAAPQPPAGNTPPRPDHAYPHPGGADHV